MRRALLAGISVGDNPRTAARAMLSRVEGAFNGGLTRAMTIARTEMLDAYRTASRYTHAANADVLDGWVWTAALDRRTCPSCWSQHGNVYPVDQPGPLDHQQGRCARVPKTKTWRQLGINLDEPPSVLPDAQTRFWQLPAADRAAIMGPARLELLRTGRIGWDDLAVRRTSTGWRDSYTPRSVADLRRLADQRRTSGAAPRPHPLAPKATPAQPTERELRALLRRASEQPTLDPEPYRGVYEGTFAGLRTQIQAVEHFPEVAGVVVRGQILDSGGEAVGDFARILGIGERGELIAYHASLHLAEDVQGTGFARDFNRRAIDWYRRTGFDRVELIANIDIGGYAWARAGYDWANIQAAESIRSRLAATLADLRERGYTFALDGDGPKQLAAAEALLDRWNDTKFGSVAYPSAYELSQLGRWPGAGRDDVWIGKLVLLGSTWEGVLRL
jgi:SPP1 gp7 family putative phage head morphogenesis protein